MHPVTELAVDECRLYLIIDASRKTVMTSLGKESHIHQTESRVSPRTGLDELGIHKYLLLLRVVEPRPLLRRAHGLVTIPTELRRPHLCMRINEEELRTTMNNDQGS